MLGRLCQLYDCKHIVGIFLVLTETLTALMPRLGPWINHFICKARMNSSSSISAPSPLSVFSYSRSRTLPPGYWSPLEAIIHMLSACSSPTSIEVIKIDILTHIMQAGYYDITKEYGKTHCTGCARTWLSLAECTRLCARSACGCSHQLWISTLTCNTPISIPEQSSRDRSP